MAEVASHQAGQFAEEILPTHHSGKSKQDLSSTLAEMLLWTPTAPVPISFGSGVLL